MELFRNIRLKAGSSLLRKKALFLSRTKHYNGFQNVKTIGVVWDATRSEDFTYISRFHQTMHERNIEVEVLGYFPGKQLPDHLTAIRYLKIMRRKDLNFLYMPVSADFDEFTKRKFDILIDVNFRKILALNFVTTFSKAALKVGLAGSNNHESPFDIMIELVSPPEIDNYFKQTVKYLEMINNDKINTGK